MKRKAEKQTAPASNGKKQATESNAVEAQFGDNLLAEKTLKGYTNEYAASEPYKHAVVHGLMNDNLLRSVRTEIIDNIHFTPIWRLGQSFRPSGICTGEAAQLTKTSRCPLWTRVP
jgi:hypothetical protein